MHLNGFYNYNIMKTDSKMQASAVRFKMMVFLKHKVLVYAFSSDSKAWCLQGKCKKNGSAKCIDKDVIISNRSRRH